MHDFDHLMNHDYKCPLICLSCHGPQTINHGRLFIAQLSMFKGYSRWSLPILYTPPKGRGIIQRLISGVSAFINKTENMTPSGYPLNRRSSITRAPMPMPKIHFPADVTGLVTGSVAMKKAPKNKAPPNRW